MMSFASTSPPPPGKQDHTRFCLRGSTEASKARALDRARRLTSRPVVQAENGGLGDLVMPKAAQSQPLYAFCCFPPASPALAPGTGKQKTAPKDRSKHLIFFRKSGAGEGIRTLDPNLGKVHKAPEPSISAGITRPISVPAPSNSPWMNARSSIYRRRLISIRRRLYRKEI
jgi:hypothetical protein